MIKNAALLNTLNNKYLRKSKRSYKEALQIFEALWQEAVHQGAIPFKNPLAGLEKDFRIAKALNHPQHSTHV